MIPQKSNPRLTFLRAFFILPTLLNFHQCIYHSLFIIIKHELFLWYPLSQDRGLSKEVVIQSLLNDYVNE